MRHYSPYTTENTALTSSVIKGTIETDYTQEKAELQDENGNILRTIEGMQSMNRCWHLDQVQYDVSTGQICSIIQTTRHSEKVIGIIRLDDKQKYGYNKRGVPIYLMKPLSRHYPPMMVTSTAAKKYPSSAAIYILATFKEWTTEQKYPFGCCQEVIGTNGTLLSDIYARMWYHDLLGSYRKQLPAATEMDNDPYASLRRDFINEDVFSIDPLGCVDIDDAIHVRTLSDTNQVEVGVHIADATSFFPLHGDIDLEARHRSFTVYLPDKQIPIIPETLSHDKASLMPNQLRRTLTCLFTFDYDAAKDAYSQSHTTIVPGIIRSKGALVYEDVDRGAIAQPKLKQSVKLLYRITESQGDSHKMIEKLMVWANIAVAQFLKQDSRHPFVLRNHLQETASTSFENNDWTRAIIEQYGSKPAQYIAATSDTPDSTTFHHSIGVPLYTHFTSPIRRYADQLVHRLVYRKLHPSLSESEEESSLSTMLEHINQQQRKHKRFQRDSALLRLCHESPEAIYDLEGMVLPFKHNTTSSKIYIAIPSLKVVFPLRIIASKLSHMVNIQTKGNTMDISYSDGTSVQLKEGQNVPLSLYFMPQEVQFAKKYKIVCPILSQCYFHL